MSTFVPPNPCGPFDSFEECYKAIGLYDTYYHRHFSRDPLIIRAYPHIPEPLEVGCSTCGSKLISPEENGICRVCNFSADFVASKTLHSPAIVDGRELIVSRSYEIVDRRPIRRFGHEFLDNQQRL